MSRAEITGLCARWGGDPLLVQAAGGNVSWKDGNALWIKGSGMWLADAARKDIFVAVDLPALQGALGAGEFNVKPRALAEGGLRPSIETVLHALMPHRLVVHLHVVDAIARLVRADGGEALERVRATGLRCVEVGYYKPGAALAGAVNDSLVAASGADVVLMRNHGVVVGGEHAQQVAETFDRLRAALACPVVAPLHLAAATETAALVPVSDRALHALATDPRLLAHVTHRWALYPDHVVFLGPHATVLDDLHALSQAPAATELAFVRGIGVYVHPQFSAAKLAQLRCYFDVIVRQTPDAALRFLSGSEIADLLDWDAERYRQSLPAHR